MTAAAAAQAEKQTGMSHVSARLSRDLRYADFTG